MTDHAENTTEAWDAAEFDPDELTVELIHGTVETTDAHTQELTWTPMRSDAAEIEYRFAQSSQRLRELRAQKQNLFDLIRDEVIANNRLARAAKIYNIELEGDSGGDDQ